MSLFSHWANISFLQRLNYFSFRLISYLSNLPSGGFWRLPDSKAIAFTGHVSIQIPQEKQSGIILFCFRMASITVEGQAFEQA